MALLIGISEPRDVGATGDPEIEETDAADAIRGAS